MSRSLLEPLPRLAARSAQLLQAWMGRRDRGVLFVAHDLAWHYAPHHAGPEPVPDVPAWLRSRRGEPVRLVLSSRCCKAVLFEGAAAGLSRSDSAGREALARARLMQLWGPAAQTWPLRSWAGTSVHGACAWAEPQAPAWLDAARQGGTRVQSVLPWWSVALQALALQRPDWGGARPGGLLLCEGAHATWLVVRDGEVVVLRQRRAAATTVSAAAALCREQCAQDGVVWADVCVIGYGLQLDAPLAFDLQQMGGTLDGTAPEAPWLHA